MFEGSGGSAARRWGSQSANSNVLGANSIHFPGTSNVPVQASRSRNKKVTKTASAFEGPGPWGREGRDGAQCRATRTLTGVRGHRFGSSQGKAHAAPAAGCPRSRRHDSGLWRETAGRQRRLRRGFVQPKSSGPRRHMQSPNSRPRLETPGGDLPSTESALPGATSLPAGTRHMAKGPGAGSRRPPRLCQRDAAAAAAGGGAGLSPKAPDGTECRRIEPSAEPLQRRRRPSQFVP